MRSSIKTFIFALAAMLVLTTAATANAQQRIWYNGVPDNQNGLAVFSPYTTADDFTLGPPTDLGYFEWYVDRLGIGGPNSITSNFDWAVYSDASGSPGPSVATGSVTNATGTKTAFFCCRYTRSADAYLFSNISFGGLSLGSGTYWLAISNYLEPGGPPFGAFWASSNNSAGNARNSRGGAWQPYQMEVAFSIYGTESTVPEPASMALLGTGLVGLFGAARHRRGSAA